MSWTNWRKIAEGKTRRDDDFDYDGPACYELSISGPKGGDREIVYVGETKNETRRICKHASGKSHIKNEIGIVLRNGWSLWYRGWVKKTRPEAKAMQDRLLDEFDYQWNIVQNLD